MASSGRTSVLASVGGIIVAGMMAAGVLHAQHIPRVNAWLSDPPSALDAGALVSARVSAVPSAYLLAFRITTDNRIVILLPKSAESSYRVPASGLAASGLDVSFRAESVDGVGHVFVAGSYVPFDMTRIKARSARATGTWDTGKLVVARNRDPIDAADDFVRSLIPSRTTPYAVANVEYYVGVTPPKEAYAQQTSPDARQNSSPTVFAVPLYAIPPRQTIVVGDPFYSDVYAYDACVRGLYPCPAWWNGLGWSWYGPYSPYRRGGARPQTVRRCPDGSVVPANRPCPIERPRPPAIGRWPDQRPPSSQARPVPAPRPPRQVPSGQVPSPRPSGQVPRQEREQRREPTLQPDRQPDRTREQQRPRVPVGVPAEKR